MKTANKIMMPNGEEIGIDGLYGKITNCLLEVPQRIKLELNNGVLTLKAGSQVIVPNGFEDDGVTKKFDEYVLDSDYTLTQPYGGNLQVFINIFLAENRLGMGPVGRFSSGTTAPLSSSTGSEWWYDTNTNLVKYYANGSYNGYNTSLPIAICTKGSNDDNLIASIDQTFNGIGYIGSTVWVDKGVKGLIPKGRNEDGSLKNLEYTTSKVTAYTLSGNSSVFIEVDSLGNITSSLYSVQQESQPAVNQTIWYKPSSNELKRISASGVLTGFSAFNIATCNTTNGVISNFQPKQPIRIPDIQDVVRKTGDTMTGALNVTDSFQIINSKVTKGTKPSSDSYWGIMLNGNNEINTWQGKRLAVMEACAKTDGSVSLTIGATQNATDSTTTASLNLSINSSGQPYFKFPMCTTKASTTSSAADNRVAVVNQNYVNGTTWYRVWSDGWIEQGGNSAFGSSSKTASVSLPKTFSNTNYTVVANDCFVSSSGASGSYPVGIVIRSSSKFDLASSNTGVGVRWYACGY